MDMKRRLFLLLVGVIGIGIGLSEYISGRAHNSAYFLNNLPFFKFIANHLIAMPHIYGRLGLWLPDFFHVFSFSLITIGLFSTSRRSTVAFCLLWLGINVLFEVGQRYGAEIAPYIPSWFAKIPILENGRNYFLNGRFDIFDVMAVCLGAAFAYLISGVIMGGAYEKIKTSS